MANKLLATLNIKATVELCKEWEYTYYPSTTLRRIDGWNYPDPVCDGWRWLYGMPYVSLDNKKSMRIFNENINSHVFLLKVEPDEVQVGEEYLIVRYSHDYDKEPDKYCHIKSWAHFHEEDPNGMIHHRVDAIKTDKQTKEKYAECTVVGQKIKKYRTEEYSLNSFYRIVRIKEAVNFE